ncbi:MAG: hypothetical protein AAB537_01200 [Patescibacteria group bacterium]
MKILNKWRYAMRHIKGLADIKTHSTLDRGKRLVSVARDWHRVERSSSPENESWDGSIGRMMFKRNTKALKARRFPPCLFQDIALKGKILATEIARVREFISEIEMFADEGVSGALAELQHLRAKLSRLEGGV